MQHKKQTVVCENNPSHFKPVKLLQEHSSQSRACTACSNDNLKRTTMSLQYRRIFFKNLTAQRKALELRDFASSPACWYNAFYV